MMQKIKKQLQKQVSFLGIVKREFFKIAGCLMMSLINSEDLILSKFLLVVHLLLEKRFMEDNFLIIIIFRM